MRFLIRLVITAVALWVAVVLVDGITFTGNWISLLLVALVFGVVNAIVRPLLTLLTCPLHTPVVVARVTDQDAAFLRFIESHDLKPGQTIEVEARDEVSDSVRLKGKNDQRMTIGARAASKLLVSAQ